MSISAVADGPRVAAAGIIDPPHCMQNWSRCVINWRQLPITAENTWQRPLLSPGVQLFAHTCAVNLSHRWSSAKVIGRCSQQSSSIDDFVDHTKLWSACRHKFLYVQSWWAKTGQVSRTRSHLGMTCHLYARLVTIGLPCDRHRHADKHMASTTLV